MEGRRQIPDCRSEIADFRMQWDLQIVDFRLKIKHRLQKGKPILKLRATGTNDKLINLQSDF
jgi:hypothetical protein